MYRMSTNFFVYSVGDIVPIQGVDYVCIFANVGNPPPNPVYWRLADIPVVESIAGLSGVITQSVVSGGSYANVGNDIQLTISPLPAGKIIANSPSFSWTQFGTTNSYTGSIAVDGLTDNSIVTANIVIDSTWFDDNAVTAAETFWLVGVNTSGGLLTFIVYGDPTSAQYYLSWAVHAF